MKVSPLMIIVAFLASACVCARLRAEVFTAPLELVEKSGDRGQYLSGDFDFHTQFSQIDSVTLNFTMPKGYQGTSVVTDSSTLSRELSIRLHSLTTPAGFLTEPDVFPIYSAFALTLGADDVPFSVPQQSYLRALVAIDPATDEQFNYWPDYLYSGQGSLAVTDFQRLSTYSVIGEPSTGDPAITTITWLLPGEIANTSLTIVGTAVPEPGAGLLMAIGAVGILLRGRIRRAEG
ncbi:MAG TPA: PEP-CTERM sorting domain-containing protein [Pirellulales bacterium]